MGVLLVVVLLLSLVLLVGTRAKDIMVAHNLLWILND